MVYDYSNSTDDRVLAACCFLITVITPVKNHVYSNNLYVHCRLDIILSTSPIFLVEYILLCFYEKIFLVRKV